MQDCNAEFRPPFVQLRNPLEQNCCRTDNEDWSQSIPSKKRTQHSETFRSTGNDKNDRTCAVELSLTQATQPKALVVTNVHSLES